MKRIAIALFVLSILALVPTASADVYKPGEMVLIQGHCLTLADQKVLIDLRFPNRIADHHDCWYLPTPRKAWIDEKVAEYKGYEIYRIRGIRYVGYSSVEIPKPKPTGQDV